MYGCQEKNHIDDAGLISLRFCFIIVGVMGFAEGCHTLKKQNKPPEYSKQAAKFLNKQEKHVKQRIKTCIEKIPAGDIIPYQANKKYFRLRVGDFRILFSWLTDEQIFIAVIDSRGQVYKKGV